MFATSPSAPPFSDELPCNLTLESTLQELHLHDRQLEADSPGKEAAKLFDANPVLPGIVLLEQGQLVGMISRRRFLEQMSRPYGLDLFLNRPLRVLYQFVSTEFPVFSSDTLIVVAAREALKRSPEHLYEPIAIELKPQVYRLLDVHQLLMAQSQIHELAKQLLNEQAQAQMIQAEKMASLGRMVAGVAHEILNPVNFIWGNISHLSSHMQSLVRLLLAYESENSVSSNTISELKEEIEIDFVLKDLPQIINSMKLGSERLKMIAGGLRSFSHMDESQLQPADLHQCIDNTLLILNNRLKSEIDVIRNYGDLPLVNCYSGQLSQVFMNLISNAIDTLMEKKSQQNSGSKRYQFQPGQTQAHASGQGINWQPQIEITTKVYSTSQTDSTQQHWDESSRLGCLDWVSICITDNGCGIPGEIQKRIFENFFTTKPVGKGTGLGLAISYSIVTEKHHGKLNLKSQLGVGSEFEILLPLLS
jgi:two-component system NtrC family sensor kinase